MRSRWYLILICILAFIGIGFAYSYVGRISLFNKYYSIFISSLDLSNEDINRDISWASNLNRFTRLKTVYLPDNSLYYEQKEELVNTYPNIEFKIVPIVTIGGLDYSENTTVIDLSAATIDLNLLDELDKLPNLEKIIFGDIRLSFDIQQAFYKKYPDMEFDWLINLNNEYYDNLSESLDLSNEKIDSYDNFIASLKLFKNLKSLDMSDTNLSNEQLGELRNIFKDVRIDWVVYFGQWHMRTDAVAFSVLIKDFSHKRLTSSDIEVLKYCTELKALDLGHQAIDDISVIGDYLPDLRLLILADNQISDLTPLIKLKKLHYLELFMNKIEDLTPLSELDGLVDLNISHNYRLSNINPILNLSKLERLWLVSCNIKESDYALLRKTYPNAIVSSVGRGSTDRGWRTHKRYYALVDMFRNNYISDLFLMYD